ncbi:hypothetical protein FRAHR75_20018 [Frankia sp. Hr75.2]|nr:hypothetical protein FRAHR75_20018 [Frankia sp. Hr75.2]SQD96995.1 hypothetical protein FMEAI12_3890012 [Parafrankia sp. Ea1.12]
MSAPPRVAQLAGGVVGVAQHGWRGTAWLVRSFDLVLGGRGMDPTVPRRYRLLRATFVPG